MTGPMKDDVKDGEKESKSDNLCNKKETIKTKIDRKKDFVAFDVSSVKKNKRIDFYHIIDNKEESKASMAMNARLNLLCKNINKYSDTNEIVEEMDLIANEYLIELQLEENIDQVQLINTSLDPLIKQQFHKYSSINNIGDVEEPKKIEKSELDLSHYDTITDVFDTAEENTNKLSNLQIDCFVDSHSQKSKLVNEDSYKFIGHQTIVPATIQVSKNILKREEGGNRNTLNSVYTYLKNFEVHKVEQILLQDTKIVSDMTNSYTSLIKRTELTSKINQLPIIYKEIEVVKNIDRLDWSNLKDICIDILLSITTLRYVYGYSSREDIGRVIDFCNFYSAEAYRALATFDLNKSPDKGLRVTEQCDPTAEEKVNQKSFFEFFDMPPEIIKMLKNR